jgi:hypothetical protein
MPAKAGSREAFWRAFPDSPDSVLARRKSESRVYRDRRDDGIKNRWLDMVSSYKGMAGFMARSILCLQCSVHVTRPVRHGVEFGASQIEKAIPQK